MSTTELTNGFRAFRDAQSRHIAKTLERHPVTASAMREKRRADAAYIQRLLDCSLKDAEEAGEPRVARDLRDAIEAVAAARGGIK